MLDHYTPDARKVIFFARYEASRLQSPTLEAEHLWLGVLRQNKRLLKRHAPHITEAAIAARLALFPTSLERVSMTADMPMSAAVKRIVANTTDDAAPSRGPIKVEDLILSLIREDALAATPAAENSSGAPKSAAASKSASE